MARQRMPRGRIGLKEKLEYLSVLGADGSLDEAHDPGLPDDLLRELHRAMLLARRFDERLLNLQRQGRLGTFAPVKGQEAAQLGAVAAIERSDWMVPSYRETAAAIWRGLPLEGLFLYIAGYNEGGAIPDGHYDLPIAIPVGTQMLHAVGLAYAAKLKRQERIALTFFGDGATSQGDFHEAMNFAAVFEAPVVFVCQNNQWAISVPRNRQTRSETLAQKALAYGLPGIQVDGNDLLAVYAATTEAVERARAGKGATLIECVTYRLEVHTTADDPTRYRDDEEVEEWRKRDPLPRLQRHLKSRDLLSDDDIEQLEESIKQEIAAAWEAAQDEMARIADPARMFDHVYADLPPHLEAQREQLRQALDRRPQPPPESEGSGKSESKKDEDEDGTSDADDTAAAQEEQTEDEKAEDEEEGRASDG